MKKLGSLLLVLSFALGLNSCSSDDGGNGLPEYTVVGKWKIVNYTVNGVQIDDCENKGIRQFKTDKTYLQEDWEIHPETEVCTESEDSPLIGNFSSTPMKLTTTVGGLTKTYDLEFTNENQFTLTDQYNNIDFVYTYRRQ
ncbi:MAG TPA: hypothetical protein VL022_00675 [Moheibacter sp.]|nr:hypothetical protein [Moheibacter sp.]